MKKELDNPFKEDLQKNEHYREFLTYLGIDPEDFEDEFEVEFDDYSK